jgi:hypothetical protein
MWRQEAKRSRFRNGRSSGRLDRQLMLSVPDRYCSLTARCLEMANALSFGRFLLPVRDRSLSFVLAFRSRVSAMNYNINKNKTTYIVLWTAPCLEMGNTLSFSQFLLAVHDLIICVRIPATGFGHGLQYQ